MKIIVPNINSNEEEYEIVKWNFENKNRVKKNDILVIIESTKVAEEIISEKDGYIEILYPSGAKVKAGTCIGEIFQEIKEIKLKKIIKKKNKNIIITAKAKKIILENNLNYENFKHLNVIKENDVLDYLNNKEDKESFIIIFFKEKKPYHAAIYIENEGIADLSLLGNKLVPVKDYNFNNFEMKFFKLNIKNFKNVIKFLKNPVILTEKIIKKEKSKRGWFKTSESPDYILKFRSKRSKDINDVNCIEWLVLALEKASIILPDTILTAEGLFRWSEQNLEEIKKTKVIL